MAKTNGGGSKGTKNGSETKSGSGTKSTTKPGPVIGSAQRPQKK